MKKKEELIKLKTELNQKKYDFGKNHKFRLEPLKNWIESAGTVEKFVSSKDFCFEKSLLEKIGTKRILMDKKVQMNLVAPHNLIAKYKALAEEEDKNKTGDEVFSTTSPAWWN